MSIPANFLEQTALQSTGLSLSMVRDVTITGSGSVPELAFGSRTGYPNTVLKSVNIAGNINTIGNMAFSKCAAHTEVILSENVKTIEYSAFSECENLAEITLPAGIESLGEFIFSACSKLASVNYGGTLDEWEEVQKDEYWVNGAYNMNGLKVICSDGEKWEYPGQV